MAETIDVTPSVSSHGNDDSGSTNSHEPDVSSSMTLTHVLYAMHAIAPFTLWTLAILAMIIGAVKRDDVRGSFLDSHFGYLSRTFWWGLLSWLLAWGAFWVLGLLTLGIGMMVLWILPAAVFIWYLYRVIRGWLTLNDRKPME